MNLTKHNVHSMKMDVRHWEDTHWTGPSKRTWELNQRKEKYSANSTHVGASEDSSQDSKSSDRGSWCFQEKKHTRSLGFHSEKTYNQRMSQVSARASPWDIEGRIPGDLKETSGLVQARSPEEASMSEFYKEGTRQQENSRKEESVPEKMKKWVWEKDHKTDG